MLTVSRSPLRGALLPLGLALSLAVPLPSHATLTETFGGPGGAHFASMCPSGMVLAGVHARTGGWVDAVAPICARIDPVSKKLQRPYRTQGEAGGSGGSVQERFCDGDRPVTGLALTHTIGNGLDRQYVNSIGLLCDGQDRIQQCIGSGEGCGLVSRTSSTTVGTFALGHRTRDYKNDSLLCGRGEVATGLQGRAGSYLDALGLACGPAPQPRGLPGTVMPAVRSR